jgi:hypothetical protein
LCPNFIVEMEQWMADVYGRIEVDIELEVAPRRVEVYLYKGGGEEKEQVVVVCSEG